MFRSSIRSSSTRLSWQTLSAALRGVSTPCMPLVDINAKGKRVA